MNPSHPTPDKTKASRRSQVCKQGTNTNLDAVIRHMILYLEIFLTSSKEYKEQVLLKMERGKLDKIIHVEKRRKMRGEKRVMTLQEALKYDKSSETPILWKKQLHLNLSEETASQIMDQHVLVIPDDA